MSGPMPMPARERYYPGTKWTVRSDYFEVPQELRGRRVVLFTEILSEPPLVEGGVGILYTYAHFDGEDPAENLIRIDDLCWLE